MKEDKKREYRPIVRDQSGKVIDRQIEIARLPKFLSQASIAVLEKIKEEISK